MKGRFAAFLLLTLFVTPIAVFGQTARGRVVDAGTRLPIAGAHVLLIDERGARHRSTLTDDQGLFQLIAANGRYRIRAEMIGRRSATSEPFEFGQGITHQVTLELPVAPVSLAGLDVQSSKKCEIRSGTTQQTQVVWEEARKSLSVEMTVRAQGYYHFDITQFERETDLNGLVSKEAARFVSRFTGTPFTSKAPDVLAAMGYREQRGEEAWLFAPNSDVLLSESFLDTHCFYLRRDDDHPNQLGLTFEPVRGRRVTDIEGVLWLNEKTAELLTLKFTYVNHPERFARARYGGRAEFRRLPSGAVIVHRWQIASPLIELYEDHLQGRAVPSERVIGTQVTGGEVLGITSRDRNVLEVTQRATLEGLVFDSTFGLPVDSAEVYLVGTTYSTRADRGGRFRLDNLPPGRYAVSFRDPTLGVLRIHPDTSIVELQRGKVTVRDLAVPRFPRPAMTLREARRLDSLIAAARQLGRHEIAREFDVPGRLNRDTLPTGLTTPARIFGNVVLHDNGMPLASVRVHIVATSFEAQTDTNGRFEFDDVEPGKYQIIAESPGHSTQRTEFVVEGGRDLRMTIRLLRLIPLDTIAVTARSARLSEVGFYERQRESGLSGFFITRQDIERRNPPFITDLIDDASGVRVIYSGPGKRTVRFSRGFQGTCEPNLYLDDLLYRNASGEMTTDNGGRIQFKESGSRVENFDALPVVQIEGVEIYVGAAIPTKYSSANGCGVILIWTRRGL